MSSPLHSKSSGAPFGSEPQGQRPGSDRGVGLLIELGVGQRLEVAFDLPAVLFMGLVVPALDHRISVARRQVAPVAPALAQCTAVLPDLNAAAEPGTGAGGALVPGVGVRLTSASSDV